MIRRHMPMKENVPVWEKVNLSLEEASAYSGIGINKLRELTNAKDCKFVLWVGNKRLIKRRQFEEFIAQSYSVWTFWWNHRSCYDRITVSYQGSFFYGKEFWKCPRRERIKAEESCGQERARERISSISTAIHMYSARDRPFMRPPYGATGKGKSCPKRNRWWHGLCIR